MARKKKDHDESRKPKVSTRRKPEKGATAPAAEARPVPVSAEQAPAPAESSEPSFPIVGIGASAGGLTAFEAFFANMPPDTESGMAFVVVQHLDPDHKSILTDLIRRYTRMRAFEVADGMTIEPNCTYIIPPKKDMALLQGRLHLMEPAAPRGLRLPIDFFFRSLAQDQGEQAICVVLSGTGTDGTLGLRAVKAAGGMVMVQEADSAAYDGMPRSALSTGLADFVLPPKDMPAQLIAYVRHAFKRKVRMVAEPLPDIVNCLPKIIVLLRSRHGHDFSRYKQSTLRRRVERRMAVHQIERVDHYVRYLGKNPDEVDILFRELLIGVTSFFRDPEAFEALREHAIASLFADRPSGAPVRIWVPGCSTGEEAYSIAMLLQEQTEKLSREFNIQVFATDIDRDALQKARAGIYPSNIAADVTPDRLARFFAPEGDSFYRIKKSTRDLLVFAEQDLIRDPPFSKLHLLSCRNLLIYLEPELQKKLVPVFHYALNPGGFLLLGGSETTGEFLDLFDAVDRKWKLYQRKEGVAVAPVAVATRLAGDVAAVQPTSREDQKEKKTGVREATEVALLHAYAPACVTANERGDILYVHGRTGKYLELAPGEVSLNLLRTAREGLRLELATALRKAAAHRGPVHYESLRVQTNGGAQYVNLTVRPIDTSPDASLLLVTFEDAPTLPAAASPVPGEAPGLDARDEHISALERDLKIKEDYLQTTVEELETANEELKSTNEELQSTNEELQSTNEELETSKEELQSVNEELVTVNNELQQKIEGLSRANNDMNNLLAGTGIGTIFVDCKMRVQRFTPAATQLINLIQTDIGRPVGHIVSNLEGYSHLIRDIRAVLDTLVPREAELRTAEGQWYLMRILPYRTTENVIEGAVITFVDITEQKRLRGSLRDSEVRHRQFLECLHSALIVFDAQGRVRDCNEVALQRHGYRREEFLRLRAADLVQGGSRAAMDKLLAEVISGEAVTAQLTLRAKDGEAIEVETNACMSEIDGEVVVMSVSRDSNGQRQAGEAERWAGMFFRDSRDAVTVQDIDGRILAWNPAAERMYGWSAREALAMNVREWVPESRLAAWQAFVGRVAGGEIAAPLDTQRITKDGRTLGVRLAATALVDASGKAYAVATTERARA